MYNDSASTDMSIGHDEDGIWEHLGYGIRYSLMTDRFSLSHRPAIKEWLRRQAVNEGPLDWLQSHNR